MSFLHNLSQWNKLDTKNQRASLKEQEMKFPRINCEIRKKRLLR